jgi:hypothetical protein
MNDTVIKDLYIIVHGTWSDHPGNWFMPESDFFKTLEQHVKPGGGFVIPFLWSGSNSHMARIWSGKALAQLIASYPPELAIHLICHSHGGNIGFIASHALAQQAPNRQINSFFSLATPINTLIYAPHPAIIQKGWHIFSNKDSVQSILGRFKRYLEAEWRFTNIRLRINGIEPEHFQIHDPIVARWIAHQVITNQQTETGILIHRLDLATDQSMTEQSMTEKSLASAQNGYFRKNEYFLEPDNIPKKRTTTSLIQTVSSAIKLAHYKAKSMQRARIRKKQLAKSSVENFTKPSLNSKNRNGNNTID